MILHHLLKLIHCIGFVIHGVETGDLLALELSRDVSLTFLSPVEKICQLLLTILLEIRVVSSDFH